MRRHILPLLLAAALLAAGGCALRAPAPPEPEEPAEIIQDTPEIPPEPADPAPDAPEPGDFVRVRDYLPQVGVDLRYAGTDNFTGQVIYGTAPWKSSPGPRRPWRNRGSPC